MPTVLPHRYTRSASGTLVLSGGLDVAAAFLTAGLVGRVVAYLPDGPASRRPNLATPWPLLPPGFVVKGATRMNGFIRIDAEFNELGGSIGDSPGTLSPTGTCQVK
jgi:hypothetical protein